MCLGRVICGIQLIKNKTSCCVRLMAHWCFEHSAIVSELRCKHCWCLEGNWCVQNHNSSSFTATNHCWHLSEKNLGHLGEYIWVQSAWLWGHVHLIFFSVYKGLFSTVLNRRKHVQQQAAAHRKIAHRLFCGAALSTSSWKSAIIATFFFPFSAQRLFSRHTFHLSTPQHTARAFLPKINARWTRALKGYQHQEL